MTKIKLKVAETPSGRRLCLCDEEGHPLPAQQTVTIQSQPDDFDRATVVFILGDDCPVVGEDQ